MDVMSLTSSVNTVTLLTWITVILQQESTPHIFVICVVKNGSMQVGRCKGTRLQLLICNLLVVGYCWVNDCLLRCRLYCPLAEQVMLAVSKLVSGYSPAATRCMAK